MTYSMDKLVAELTRDEGLRLKTYRCTAGKLTIGIGRNLDDVGVTGSEARLFGCETPAQALAHVKRHGVTKLQAESLFANDIVACERDLDRNSRWWRTLDDVRQRVLLNMCFNLGITRLLPFKTTLRHIERREFEDAADQMLKSLWARQVGARALRLSAMMRTGKDAR
ncbi:glycoside hydrolase family protein [uncultured Sphingomonas sp.]|uniref:glycoside hydrolase family protein n=1 Tax=uncultured Sphingomonas sp. TaxID=158754 RepID=UPI0025F4E51E|nr:glycoside hydrolase family protein [uncultured Sphingomonas sp.]